MIFTPMFTGIIESIGEVVETSNAGAILTLTIRSGISAQLKRDQSVSHNGVCLTVVSVQNDTHSVQLVAETIDRSAFGSVRMGDRINLERSLPVSGRFEGHIVQGHVDGVGTLLSIDDGIFMFRYPPVFSAYLIEKGSVCVHGVSLTVARLIDDTFGVALIPHTLQFTNFADLKPGTDINLEFDMIAKHLIRLLELRPELHS
jgi:riboflavin synthase